MNPSVIFICLILAFVAFTETNAVRGGWASGADQDRDPTNPNYYPEGRFKLPYYSKVEGQNADATAKGENPSVQTFTGKKGPNRVSVSSAKGSQYASSYASAE